MNQTESSIDSDASVKSDNTNRIWKSETKNERYQRERTEFQIKKSRNQKNQMKQYYTTNGESNSMSNDMYIIDSNSSRRMNESYNIRGLEIQTHTNNLFENEESELKHSKSAALFQSQYNKKGK